MAATVGELAQLIGGEVIGDRRVAVSAAKPISDADQGDITFALDEQYARQLGACRASAAIVARGTLKDTNGSTKELTGGNGLALIVVDDPLSAFATVVGHLRAPQGAPAVGVHPQAQISPCARLGSDVTVYAGAFLDDDVLVGDRAVIYPGVYVGAGSRLGDDVVLHPNAVLYPGTLVGNRVVIHACSVIGSDGFGYRTGSGAPEKIPQMGHVEIGDDVEIGACTTIDRGTFGATTIGEGTKIDNLVQIAHNCRIGRRNMLVSQMGIAGSSTTGNNVVAAGQVGIVDHVKIGDGAVIGAQAGITKDVAAGACVVGSPATPVREQKRIVMSLGKLPEMRKQLRRLTQQVEELTQQHA